MREQERQSEKAAFNFYTCYLKTMQENHPHLFYKNTW